MSGCTMTHRTPALETIRHVPGRTTDGFPNRGRLAAVPADRGTLDGLGVFARKLTLGR